MLNVKLGALPKYCTVRDMNYTGEVMHGELKHDDAWGAYYIMADGDCYQPETLQRHYNAEFSDEEPLEPNYKIEQPRSGKAL